MVSIMSCLTVILKMTERCNLNCSYCYFFNGKDPSYKERPAIIAQNNIKKLIDFLIKGIDDLSLTKIVIGFHGGEPLIFKKTSFNQLCVALKENLGQKIVLSFSLQTNGLLIDHEWLEIFQKHKIDIGISIDGPKDFHDKYRVDHKGRGSYDRLIHKINMMNEKNIRFGVLSVINPEIGAKRMYNFITEKLKVKSFDLLFPHLTHDDKLQYSMDEFANFMCEIYNLWVQSNNKVKIRIFTSFLNQLLGGSKLLYGIGAVKKHNIPLITVRSDGKLEPVTGLMHTDPNTVMDTKKNINDTTLKEFVNLQIFKELEEAQTIMPQQCTQCCWEKICGGGHIIDRFSLKNRFNNPTTYCSVMKKIYAQMSKYLIDSGIPLEKIHHTLDI